MSYYLTLREGPSAAASIPLLVVSDERVVGAFLRELGRITRGPVSPARPLSVPEPPSTPLQKLPKEQQPEGLVRS